MKWLLVDNYDSFTYNLVDLIHSQSVEVDIVRNDALSFLKIPQYDAIVLSPGPGLPETAGKMMSLINDFIGNKPILGVCLGMQALALHLGDDLVNQAQVKHGIQTICKKTRDSILLEGVPVNFEVGLYHSWKIRGNSSEISITSISDEGVIMSIENKKKKIFGVQFHPESIMTPEGDRILKNFKKFVYAQKPSVF